MPAKTRTEARKNAQTIVDKWAKGTLITGWIPGSSFLSGTADQVMIQQVAECFGEEQFDMHNITAHLGGVVGSSVGGGVVAEVVGLVPIFGWAAKAAALSTKVRLIGKAIIDYFDGHCSLPS